MSSELQLNVLGDERVLAIEALSHRLSGLDLSPLLVYAIDRVPAAALPLLAQQFNVHGPLWAYLPDDAARRRAIKESVAWHRAKGTPWAVEAALAWAGFAARVEDGTATARRWAEYQLEMSEAVPTGRAAEVVALARFAAPARSHLVRLYHSHDLRPLQLDHSRLDDALLDDDSGVMVGGIKCSFGTRHAAALLLDEPQLSAGMTRTYSTRVWDDNSWRLDGWALDSEILLDAAGGLVAQYVAIAPLEDIAASSVRLDSYIHVSTVIDESTIQHRLETAATALPSEIRTWSGSWSGTWREPIPTRTTFEEA